MEKLDILGLPLEEGIELLKKDSINLDVQIKETFTWNKEKQEALTQARIVKAFTDKNKVTIIIGYF